ncbi:uncharacterized protein LOC117168827 isoform X2 [Belonocnema kinseyi]|uniref:uncharacterized protein LOC117168827 isoform X2 n=1 Tax=Belonocnema kinseyi TaxID=2817044 RepID=UPI00143D499F|nr:uncharacterized protein LOC117168827 isoform X2 [Belonocnema kinseyi]
MRRFNVLKKYDVVSKFDKVDMFGRTRRFRRTPSPHATEPALLCNFDEDENSDKPPPFDQTRPAATATKGRVETEEEKPTNKIDVSQYIETINLADIELPPENPKKSKKHKDKKHKSEKKDRSERKRHKEKKHREKHEKEIRACQDSLDKRLANVNFNDDANNFLLTIETGRTFMHDHMDDLSKSMSEDIDLDAHQLLGSDDEEYDRRFSDVKRYIPFLEMMIEKHRQMNDLKSLKKMECLYEVLTQSKKKLKMETLQRCEDVLEKLYHKVGEVLREETNIEAPNDDSLSTVSSSLRNTRFHQIGNLDATFEEGGMSPMSSPSSSPTPPFSPNDSFVPVDDDIDNDAIIEHLESQAESPEDGEIFDASENSNDDTDDNSVQSISRGAIPQSSKRDSDMSIDEEWEMLEEKPSSPKQDMHTWKPIIVTGHDVVTAAKLVGNNISKRAAPVPRPYTPPPKPVENKQLDEVFVDDDSYDSFDADLNDTNPRTDSPLNVPEMGLQSPDPELFCEERSNSPKKPEEPPQPVPPPAIQPIVAPPKVNDIPLISMADLEDLIKNQSKILKDGFQQQQQTKDEKDAEKEKEAAKAQELETVTPIRRKQTGNVKIAPMTLKLDAFITGAKDRSPSPEAPVDPRIRARMLKEKNLDPRLAKDKAVIPPRPPVGDLYSLHDFNINPATLSALSSPIHTTPVTPANDYNPAGSGNQWNYGSNIPMPGTPNPYGMPRDSNMHTDSWDMNPTINPNLNPNMNINRNPNMNLNRNPNMAQNAGYANNVMPLMRPAAPYSAYDSQMNYPQHPQHPQRQQYPHGPSPLDNFNTNSMQYGHQNPPSWNRPCDAIRNHRQVLNRDPRSMSNLRDVHRPEWDRERQSDWDWDRDRQSDWDRDRQTDWDRERLQERERLPERERHNDWDNRNRFSRDPRMRLEPLVSSPNQIKEVAKDTSTVRDQTAAKDQTTTKESTTTKDSTISKDVIVIKDLNTTKDSTSPKDSTTKKDSTNSKDSTTTRDLTTKKDPRLAAKEKPKAVDKEKESKKADAKDLHKSSKSSSKSDSRNPKEKERSKSKEKSRKSESRRRQEAEKGDKPQSSLENLYGVVDTKAAAGQQVLQKFKIPKLKKPGPVSSPKITTSTDTKSSRHEDLKSSLKNDDSKSRDRKDKILQSKTSSRKDREKDKEKDRDKEKDKEDKDKKKAKKQEEVVEPAKTKEQEATASSEAEKSRLKTVEDLKNFINMIIMQEGGRKLLKNEKMYEKFKKVFENEELSEFRQLVQSDSDGSDSGKNERVTKKKKPMMKKRRVIESDSSDSEGEPLAKRIEKVEPPMNEEKEAEEPKMRRKLRKRPGAAKEPEEDADKESKKETKEDTKKVEGEDVAKKDEKLKGLKEQPELIKEGETKESNESLIAEPTAPKTRAKPRRKNSLERLQEDLKDYISSGIITAGQRTCRLAKESQAVTTATTTASPNSSNLASESAKESAEINEPVKSKTKNKAGPKCAKKTVSKEFVSNSEAEEDQPLAVRKEPVKKKKMLGPKSKRQASDLALEPHILLQRADILTLEEVAKANESSSDESFSVDASEITVSPDSPTVDHSKEEITKRPRTRSGAAARKKIMPLSNKEDEAQATDDESLTSDISLSSSVASKKADEMAKTSQQLLEKGGEVAETVEDSPPTDKVRKKPPPKKKKKKSAWRLGIVSKAKRRKKQLQAQAKQVALLQSEETAIRRPSIEVVEDHEVTQQMHCADVTPTVKAEPDHPEEQEQKDSSSTKEKETVVKQEIKSEDLDRIVKKEDSIIEVESPDESDLKIVDDSVNNQVLPINVDVSQLIDYVCYGQEKAKCLLCLFSGKTIVHHYKTVHPDKEVSVSRLKALEAKCAVQESNDNDFEKTCLLPTNKKDYHFSCRFCPYKIKGRKEESMESAYEHVTSHTGEYRFKCIECNYQSIVRSTIKMHYYKNCKKLGRTIHEAVVEQKVPQENRLYGYMCSLCNFVQLRLNNVENHIKTWHMHEPSTKIVKINMSLDAPGENVVDVPETSEKAVEISLPEEEAESTNVEKRSTRSSRRNRVEAEEPQVTLPDHLDAEVEKEEAEKEARKSNLSAFVCPPEYEKKDKELELERKKKMQEIVENMGIKVNKNEAKKGLSIIDKLKDRMDTTEEPQSAESDFRGDLDSPESNLRIVESLNEESDNLLCAESLSNADISDSREVLDVSEKDKSSKLKDPLDVENEPQEDEASDSEHPSLRYEYESSSENEDATDVNDLLKETTDIRNQSNDSMVTTIQRLAAQIQSSKPLESTGAEMAADDAANSDKSSSRKEIPKAPDVLPITSFKRKSLSGLQNLPLVQEVQSLESRMEGSSPPKLFLRPRRFSGDMLSVPEPPTETPEATSPVAVPITDNTDTETSKPPATLNIATTDSDSFLKISNIMSLATPNENETPAMSDIRKAVETSNLKFSGLSVLKKNGPLILKRVKNPPSHTLSNQTIRAVNPNSHETVKLIPINITPTSSASQSNYLPIMSPATFKNYMDGKKVSIPASSRANASPTKSATLTSIPISKATTIGSLTKTGTLTPVTIAPNFSINNALQNCAYTPIKPNPFPSIKAGTITAIKPGTVTLSKTSNVVTSATSPNRKLVTLVGPNTLLKQKEQGPQYAIKMKNMAAYNEMMKPEKLRQLYKCMGRECPYTTDYVDNFRRHFDKHSTSYNVNSTGLVPFDFKKCAYCYMTAGDWFQMEKHYEEKHAYCEFQCSYCFYRAVTQAYVEIHQANVHPKKPVAVLQASATNHPRPQVEINRAERVKPFVCQNDCNKYFFVPEAFFVHLRLKHASLSVYKCHLCKVASYTPDQLIEHYKNHGILKYQCLYCNHGTENMSEMHHHLSSNHCNQKPILLERTLPPQPTKTRSAIDQLLLRNAEEQYTSVSKVIGISDKIPANLESDATRDANALARVKPLSEKAESSNYVISVAPTRSNSPPTIQIIATESLVNNDNALKTDSPFRKMTESISRAEKNRDSMNQLKESDKLLKYKQQNPQKVAKSTVDALGILQDISTEDEFINMNLLDNPEFLKTCNSTSKNNASLDDDDSDIEIIEDCGRPGSRDATVNRESPTTPDIKPKDLHLLLVADNSDISNEASNFDARSPLKSNSYLTLDDIKHTGFTGMDLYKCGTLNCNYSAPNSATLRNHIKECCVVNVPASFNNSVNFQCTHCRKAFQKIGFFMDHLEIHGLRRFSCAICGDRFAVQNQAFAHLNTKHKLKSYRLLPADPKNPSAEGLFVMYPVYKGKKKIPAPKFVEKESPKSVEYDTLTFSPNEIDLLPRQAIYNREVQCAVCRFTTKVRTNIIRHLQLHAKDESVPETGPVNPVPCLDKREKMFDKMVNLASSSHQNGRMGAKTKESSVQPEDETLPRYVPENKRYVCGISECSYLTVNEGMLRYHLKALHSEEPFFKCTHCKAQGQDAQNIVIEKMGVHLKMHDSKLYKCSHCNYFHYQRYVVERHLGDKHPEKRPFVKVIREFESNESSQSSPLEENEDETPDPDGNHWKCNACDYKCVYKAEMQTHVGNEHDERSQYKCTACPFRTNGKIQLDQHINTKHANDPEVDHQMVYQRIKGTKKLTDPVEQGTPEEPFDTTPLWRRDMPRVKHIRGILIEEEPASKASSANSTTPEKFGKRKSDTDISAKPSKVKCIKPVETDNNESQRGQYGFYGNPEGSSYECTICNQFKTKYKHDMRDHLYRELKYVRFHCKTCGFVSVNKNSLARHCSKNHEGEVPNCENLSPDPSIEEWVMTLLKRQTEAIRRNLEKLNPESGGPGSSKSASPSKQMTPRSPGKALLNTSGSVFLGSEDESDENNEEPSDEDVPEVVGEGSSSGQPKILVLICKHCKQKFNSKRGFKMHVRKQHLKQYKFLCPLCDRSANLESHIQQHIKSKHPTRLVKPVPNPSSNANDTELTDEFWQREYQVPPGKEKRGQKRKANFEEVPEKRLEANVIDDTFVCVQCNFVSATLQGHLSHQKTHKLLYKCAYCSYTDMVKIDVRRHSKSDHPHLSPNVEEIPITGNASQTFTYWCSYCSVRCKTHFAMKKHWTRAHKDPKPNEGAKWKTGPFKYTTVVQSDTGDMEIVTSSPSAPGNESEDLLGPSDEKWTCEWCNELCANRKEVDIHHRAFHSHLPLKCKPADPLQIPEDYRCPECSFEAKTYELMYKHINKHIKMYKCKYCEQSFCEPNQVTLHAEQVHPRVEPKIESVENYEEQLNDMLSRITGGSGFELEPSEHQSVAKKSTARPIVRVRPFPKKLKSVARKSTNPLPRYPPGMKFTNEHAKTRGISHYGVPKDPIDMGSINTYMVVGGHRMPVNCLTLSQLMDIDPQVVVVDIKKRLNSQSNV